MRVRLLRKLAERIDDIDLRSYAVGDTLDLPLRMAQLLIAEGWAAPEGPIAARPHAIPMSRPSQTAADDDAERAS